MRLKQMIALGAVTALVVLAACGGDAPAQKPVAAGVITAANFGDTSPVDFNAPAPQRFAVHGIDAARFQDNINWGMARANGVNFAFLKATEGGDLLDPKFKEHLRGARRAGVLTGAYHFYYFCTTPEVQARWFIRNVPRTAGSLPPVLDMEWNPFSPTCAHLRPPAHVVQDGMRRWLDIVTAHYGQRPVIYTTPKFFRENKLSQVKGYEFWLRTTAKTPREAYPGQKWTFWQYTATGTVPGIPGDTDLNAFAGSAAEWANWVAARSVK